MEAWNLTRSAITTRNIALTALQSAYLSAAKEWYVHNTIYDGEWAFLSAMINLTREFPNDTDAQSLLGLAYLNVAGQSKNGPREMEPLNLLIGRSILTYAFEKEPTHPGILHYLIHSYDVPRVNVALLGLPHAIRYSDIVLTASHAQHMPAHIFARIGELFSINIRVSVF